MSFYMRVLLNDFRKYIDKQFTCFEPESNGNLVEGLGFHKFYFENGEYPFILEGSSHQDVSKRCYINVEIVTSRDVDSLLFCKPDKGQQ